MSVSESQFEWVAFEGGVDAYQEDEQFVLHDEMRPFGWIASSHTVEVRP